MGSLASIYIKKETLKILLDTIEKKGLKDEKAGKGISLTVSISDDSNQYGQNVSVFVGQTKEQVDAKAEKYYVGNGNVFWTDGTIKKSIKPEDQPATANAAPAYNPLKNDDDLPF